MSHIQTPSPSINIVGLRVDEPVTMITDLLISLVCFYAFFRMKQLRCSLRSQIHLRNYFFFVALATALGGIIGHGFLYAFSETWKLPGWITAILSVALIERSSISHAQPLLKPRIGHLFMFLNIVEMIGILVVTIVTIDFKWVEYHNAYGLIVNVAGLHSFAYYKTRDRGSLLILFGVLVTALASFFFTQKISLHTWFNYVDISHVLLAIAGYIIYLGGRNLEDLQKHSPANPTT